MPTIDVLDKEGTHVGKLELSEEVFGTTVREHLFWEVVRAQQAARRAGTHSTKRRDEVQGGGKKPHRQKGTGRARQGSRRAPNFVGGGSVFGPKPRSYVLSVPKRVRREALRSALSLRLKENQLKVLDNLELSEIKTQNLVKILDNLEIDSALIVEKRENNKLLLSARNMADHKFLPLEGLNLYDILKYETLVTTQDVARLLDERLKPTNDRGPERRTT